MQNNKWPKILPSLTLEQQNISNDFMEYWHKALAKHGSILEKFNHNFVVKNSSKTFATTLEIGAGLGEHLEYEKLSKQQKEGYVALELRENMARVIQERYPDIKTHIGDCQEILPFVNGFFDRVIAIHVLEHLPNLPVAIKEMHRVCNKKTGQVLVVIPCEGGFAYSLGRKISAQRIFERRYKQSYDWLIAREHINKPQEIFQELEPYFKAVKRAFFPFYLPFIFCNLCIGIVLKPR